MKDVEMLRRAAEFLTAHGKHYATMPGVKDWIEAASTHKAIADALKSLAARLENIVPEYMLMVGAADSAERIYRTAYNACRDEMLRRLGEVK